MKTAEWLEALRSGDYQQTKRKLSDGDGGFCCLGVLCEVKGLPKQVVSPEVPEDRSVFYIFDGSDGSPDRMVNYAGRSAGVIPFKYQPTILEDLDLTKSVTVDDSEDELSAHLMNMNDEGVSFIEIADFIESQL